LNKALRNEIIAILIGGLLLVALIALGVQGLPSPLAILRLVLGLLYLLVIPGYTLQAALFPRRADLDSLERIALSFTLSVAAIGPIALLLDRLPWGIRLWPVVSSMGVLILASLTAALLRRMKLEPAERFELKLHLDLRGWWQSQARSFRVVYLILAVTLAVAFLTALSILILPKPAERLIEFYILGSEGQAQDYPREVTVDQAFMVTSGILNHEALASTYHIRILVGDQLIGQAGPINLAVGATWEKPIRLIIPTAGDDQQVIFILEREGQASPYRSLRLWLNVKPSASP